MRILRILGLIACAALGPSGFGDLYAEESTPPDAYVLGPLEIDRSGPDMAFLGVGAFDAFADEHNAALANVEYRFGRKLLVIGPALGLEINSDGAVYGYVGSMPTSPSGPWW